MVIVAVDEGDSPGIYWSLSVWQNRHMQQHQIVGTRFKSIECEPWIGFQVAPSRGCRLCTVASIAAHVPGKDGAAISERDTRQSF